MPEFFSVVNESSGIPILNSDAEATPGQVYIISNLPPTAPVISGVAGDGLVTITVTTAATDVEDGTVNLYNIYVDGVLHESNVTILQGGSHDVLGLTNGVQVAITLKAKDSAGALSIDSNTVVATPVAGTITRTSTGKILYDDFEDGTVSPWVIDPTTSQDIAIYDVSGNKKLKISRALSLGGIVRQTIDVDSPIYITAKMSLTASGDGRIYLENTQLHGLENKDYYAFQINYATFERIYKRVDGVDYIIQTNTTSVVSDTNEYIFTLSIDNGNIDAYKNGTSILSAVDTEFTYFDRVTLLAAGTNDGNGAYYDDVVVCKYNKITCNNLPAGYKLRVGGTSGLVAVEQNGIATININGKQGRIDLNSGFSNIVEVLDQSDEVVKTFNPTINDPSNPYVWGGDIYSY